MQTLRWGQQVVDLQKMLFPTEMTGLTAHKSAPKTCVIPLLFPQLSRDVDWKYTGPCNENGTRAEARRGRSIFTAAVTTLALEMVLASARRLTSETESTEPDILVCGCLWSFLGDLNEFHRHAIEDLCRTAHQVWRIGGTAHYDIAEWMHNDRIVYRAGQHAHGISAKVELCFFVSCTATILRGREIRPCHSTSIKLLPGLASVCTFLSRIYLAALNCHQGKYDSKD